MYFRDLDADQKAATRELLLLATNRKITEELEYMKQFQRHLVLGNGAGVVLLATFMGALAAKGDPLVILVAPLWKFFIGALLAALIYVPFLLVATNATTHMGNQFFAVIGNQIEVEKVQGYGLTKGGRILVGGLVVGSFGLFLWGFIQCAVTLGSL